MNLAGRQGGAVSRRQLRRLGLTEDRIQRLIAAGWIIRVHRGVYRLGALTPAGELFAATLAMGPHAHLSHRSAGHVQGLLTERRPAVVDVTTPTRRRARATIRPHQARLHDQDRTTRNGLPVTALGRTLLDLAAVLSAPALQAVVDEARVQRRLRSRGIEATIARAPGHHGIGALRRALARRDPGRGRPIGSFEREAIEFLRARGFPAYVRNHPIEIDGERFHPDVVWIRERVCLELDTRDYHDNDPAFVSDRRRSRRLEVAGWLVVRATPEDLGPGADELAADLWALLRR